MSSTKSVLIDDMGQNLDVKGDMHVQIGLTEIQSKDTDLVIFIRR
jgi:hypothetical protein